MDHMISLIVFIAAILIFIGLFSQNIQTGISYESHRALSTKTSDLLDTMLLNPGIPANWAQSDSAVQGFGLQDPEFTQYQISPFSLMRLSSMGTPVEYDKTSPSIFYNNVTSEVGSSLLTPVTQTLNYSTALALLGVNNTYGFQLTFTPDITVSVTENHDSLSVSASGTGFPLAFATINYCLMVATMPQTSTDYPYYSLQNGVVIADSEGIGNVPFSGAINQVYTIIACAHTAGLAGIGYHTRVSSSYQYVVPIIQDMATQEVVLAHNYDLGNTVPPVSTLKYNATFLILKQDYTISKLLLASPYDSNLTGTITSGTGNTYQSISLPAYTTGVLIVTYQDSDNQGGMSLMPWGASSLGFPITFGGNPDGQTWVSTDLRQVSIGGISYQAKLELWNQGVQVIG